MPKWTRVITARPEDSPDGEKMMIVPSNYPKKTFTEEQWDEIQNIILREVQK